MMSFWKNNPAAYFGFLGRNLKQRYEEYLAPYGLTGSLYFYLLYIDQHVDSSLADVSHKLMVDKAYVSRVISQLEKQGYISRQRNPKDSRAYLLSSTESGKKILMQMEELFLHWNEDLKSGLSEDEYDTMVRLLAKAYNIKSGRATVV